ncbi:MAG: NADase-type glycan-binding domain-containing protein [Saprospiraceae bacterium]
MKTTLFFFTLLVFSACSGNSQSQPAKSVSVRVDVQHLPPGSTLLDGVYATSTNTGSNVLNLFDDNPATHWHALPGAGPNEGILIRFAKPVQLTGLEAIGTDGAFEEAGGLMDLSFDGKTLYQSVIGEKLDLTGATDAPVREIFIRITHTNLEKAVESEIGPWFQLKNLPPAGFKSLRLFGEKGQELKLVAPAALSGTLRASSSLSPGYAYGPECLFDGHLEMAWVEANKANAGEGETIEFSFEKPVRITAFKIWNGYQRSPESFSNNARLNGFEFGLKNTALQTYTLKDTKTGQLVTLATPITGTTFQLRIKTVFPGKKYSDLALSDLVFFDGETPFTLNSEITTAKNELKNRVAKTPLPEILDRGVRSSESSLERDFSQLFTLRGDGTFSLQTITVTVDESETIRVGSGHWEILEAGSTLVKIKITGSLRTTTNSLTSPVPEKTTTGAFSEVLTVDKNTIHGQKLIGAFRFK